MMENFKDTSKIETTSDFMIEMMMDEKDGEEFTRDYLKARFLSSMGRSLYYARRQAGLTQAEVAERMKTTQSAVARFEADKNGSLSFRRYVDFAIACAMMPRSLVLYPILEPITALRDEIIVSFAAKSLQEPSHVQDLSGIARSDIIRSILSAQNQRTASLIGHTPLAIQDFKDAIENAQNTSISKITTTVNSSAIGSQFTSDTTKVKFVYA